jgi:hypothetical protein
VRNSEKGVGRQKRFGEVRNGGESVCPSVLGASWLFTVGVFKRLLYVPILLVVLPFSSVDRQFFV